MILDHLIVLPDGHGTPRIWNNSDPARPVALNESDLTGLVADVLFWRAVPESGDVTVTVTHYSGARTELAVDHGTGCPSRFRFGAGHEGDAWNATESWERRGARIVHDWNPDVKEKAS